MGDVILYVEDLKSASKIYLCRICLEEEEFVSLEAPCACSGTVKFAHRDCIQRWCNEKGNTTCEICLQKFEPGYTSPPKKAQLDDEAVTIRRSLDVPRIVVASREGELLETEYSEHLMPSDRITAFCRSTALIVTILLLVRHMFALLSGTTEDSPFTLVTLIVLRASGILVPMFIIIRIIKAMHNYAMLQYQYQEWDEVDDDDESSSDEDDDDLQYHRS